MAEAEQGSAVQTEQRVSCTSCGRLLFKLKKAGPNSTFTLQQKCKGGGCHRMLDVSYASGRVTVAEAS